jgi:DNA-binding transcriptional regulator GbsR (MarR family)
MTEITDKTGDLPEAVRRFVLHWGDMGGQWGVNRSVSQIHAFLYLSDKPQTAEDIADALTMARSNVSNSLKELIAWGLIRRVPVMGDRRDFYEAESDVWTIAAKIVAGRKERELDPAIAVLKVCVADSQKDPHVHATAKKRLKEMLAFTETVNDFYVQMEKVPRPRLMALINLGAKIINLLPARKTD